MDPILDDAFAKQRLKELRAESERYRRGAETRAPRNDASNGSSSLWQKLLPSVPARDDVRILPSVAASPRR